MSRKLVGLESDLKIQQQVRRNECCIREVYFRRKATYPKDAKKTLSRNIPHNVSS